MEAEPLLSLAVRVAAEHTVQDVLNTIVEGLAAQPLVALARIWLLSPGDICDGCVTREKCSDHTQCLHLVASAGTPINSPGEDWSFLRGYFRRMPLNSLKVGQVGTGVPILIHDMAPENENIARPEWAKREGIRSFAGHPLIFRGNILGVLALFSRGPLDDQGFSWLRMFADQAAVAITNARAFEDRKRAEEALRESEKRIQAFWDNSPNLLFIKDPDGRYLSVNKEFERALGVSKEQIKGKRDDEIFSQEQAIAFQANDVRVLQSRTPMKFEDVAVQEDGEHTSIVQKFPLFNGEGTIYAIGGIVTDITERKRAEEEVERLRKQLELENAYLHEQVKEGFAFGDIVGQSQALRKVLHQVQMVAPTDAAVLISGESGTGKELIARVIHERSSRRNHPMVKVNCASVPKELFESEFFGHSRGAFTGAMRDRTGRFELADKGTIFLDEVGEIPLELQSKLLRVLQEGEFERVGEEHTRHVDLRVIAATNRKLDEEVKAGRFREDLYYRLNVFPISLPPLRERREDIGQLAAHFLDLASRKLNCPEVRLTDHAVELLMAYDWPGNIRELHNVIERAVILCQRGPLRIDLGLGEKVATAIERDARLSLARSEFKVVPHNEINRRELENILAAVEKTQWKIYGPGGAAEILGMKPTTLASRLSRNGIKRPVK
ncbi:MAG: sigma 54-interacting transcriptional regulator [Alphaproteobacteria bacterium]